MNTTYPPDDEWPEDDDLPPPPPNPDDGSRKGSRRECTKAVIDATVKLLIAGNYLKDCANRLGFNASTFSRWRKMGKRFPDGIYGQFEQAVGKAIAEYRTRTVDEITSSDNLSLRLELLGRQYPEDFGPYRGLMGQLKAALAAAERERAELRQLREKYLAVIEEHAGTT